MQHQTTTRSERLTRTTWLVFALLLAWIASAPSAHAQSQNDEFFIESIFVEGAERFGAGIVISESLLQEGQLYSERALRDAVHRIVRLPLVLDAEFALRKGSRRGRYQLVITIEEARHWFFFSDLLASAGDDRLGFRTVGSDISTETRSDDQEDSALFAGWRTSAGRFGVFSVGIDPLDEGKLQLGFTQYNLLGRNIQLQVGYLFQPLEGGFNEGRDKSEQQTFRLGLGIPLRGNHSLSLSSSYRRLRYRTDFAPAGSYESDLDRIWAELSWVYNTLDDPVFPTTGRFLRGGVSYHQEQTSSRLSFSPMTAPPVDERRELDGSEWRAGVVADFHRTISARDSLSISARASAGAGEFDLLSEPFPSMTRDTEVDLGHASLTLGYARFLLRNVQKPRWRELRWENDVELFADHFSPAQYGAKDTATGYRLESRLRYRTSWGLFSFAVEYIQREDFP